MNLKLKAAFFFTWFVPLYLTTPAHGEDSRDLNTFTFYLENDTFSGTDRQYTSGVRLTWISPDLTDYRENHRIPDWDAPLIKGLPFVTEPGFQRSLSLSVGQSIYTPEDISRTDLIEDDRPYAGITYLAIGFHSRNTQRMHSLEFDIGIVGSHSYADECQETVHEWIDTSEPRGWKNQLGDEPVLNLFYERKWKVVPPKTGTGFGYDMIPHLGGALGNLLTEVNAGASFRFGWNLPNDFGTFSIRPGSEGNAPVDRRDPRLFLPFQRFGIHGFADVTGRAVAWNLFLDGNTFRKSHSVDKKHFVSQLGAGIAMIIGRFKVSYAFIYRTKEFKTQRDEQEFWSITLSFSY